LGRKKAAAAHRVRNAQWRADLAASGLYNETEPTPFMQPWDYGGEAPGFNPRAEALAQSLGLRARTPLGFPVAYPNFDVVTTQGRQPMNVFSGGGGGTDWGGLIGSLGGQVAGIFAQKEQNKMLKRLMRRSGGGAFIGGSPATGYGVGMPMSFAPAGVPAVGGGISAAGGLAGLGSLGALGLLPELGDLLPGGLEESGTGIFGPDLFAVGANSRRQRMIDAVHPTTGERVYWRPVGRPIMFTGDASLLKRTRKMVRKMSSTAGCGFGGRTFRRRRR